MGKALVVYSTRTTQTKKIAELIAEGMRFEGVNAEVVSTSEVETKKLDLSSYDALALGSATYHGEMMQSMKTFLFLAEKAHVEGKAGGAFGAFGWSGEAPGRIFETMQHIFKMDMVSQPLRLKSPSIGGAAKMAQDYGREIARKVPR